MCSCGPQWASMQNASDGSHTLIIIPQIELVSSAREVTRVFKSSMNQTSKTRGGSSPPPLPDMERPSHTKELTSQSEEPTEGRWQNPHRPGACSIHKNTLHKPFPHLSAGQMGAEWSEMLSTGRRRAGKVPVMLR